MQKESLAGLKVAFAAWRRKKRHVREAVPDELMERARLAVEVHGVSAVVRATKISGDRLRPPGTAGRKGRSRGASVPTFSRVELAAPVVSRPFAEVETASGVKVRLFTASEEALRMLLSLCGMGGGQ